ncbi:hypothetical protein JAAARDRAFT_197367 [Jaapia argillacea MUCL 33604]|uniref:F-box domain-containing protein n=1 Tax=Jaapia argillacea MUCL 33604 TaxID=933084 RepID=A0A067PT86_9AGAM|nr:hypothetical protein JAAARDRAFT_197367 [Jaapia argillacea MUCL 33604]
MSHHNVDKLVDKCQSSPSTLPYRQLAPELLRAIFAHVPQSDLHNVTLTCHAFRCIAQPLLFQSLVVSVIQKPERRNVGYGFDSTLPLFIQGTLQQHKDRLAFYASDHIAPSVRNVRLSIIMPHLEKPQARLLVPSGNELINEFFDVLPSFAGLETLFLSQMDFTPRRLAQLASLKCLPYLSLDVLHCMVSAQTPPIPSNATPRIGIADFKMESHARDYFGRQQSVADLARWSCFLQPTRLRSLRILRDVRLAEALLPHLAGDTFDNLRVLHIPCGVTASPHFVNALAQSPALKELLVSRIPSITPSHFPVSSSDVDLFSLPKLECYGGPTTLLDIFPPGHHARSLRKLTLWGPLPDGASEPTTTESCIQRLMGFERLVGLKSLHFFVTNVTESLLRVIGESTTSLEDLCITLQTHDFDSVEDGVLKRGSLFPSLTRQLPPSLQTLTVQTCFTCASEGQVHGEMEELVSLGRRRHLRSLRQIQLAFDGYWVTWGNSSPQNDGIIVERVRRRFGFHNELEVSLFHDHRSLDV